MKNLLNDIRVGWFLGIRQIRRSNIWTTLLIVLIMTLTFLNLIVVSGILVGLIEGGNRANRNQYTGDVIITTPSGKSYLEQTQDLLSVVQSLPQVVSWSDRMLTSVSLEANYQSRNFQELPNTAGGQLTGIDIDREIGVSGINQYIAEGSFLVPGSSGTIVLGKNLLRRYSESFGDTFPALDDVYIGDKILVRVGEKVREFTVVGILDSKVGEISLRAFVTQNDFLSMAPRPAREVNEISLTHNKTVSDEFIRDIFIERGFDGRAKIQTAVQAIPDFLNQIKTAFALLGSVIGGIGILVASITIFIVIFINAVTRRKYIGILKGIGISGASIRIAYILQSLLYACLGSALGSVIIYTLLVPFFEANPLDFPFSDGILVAPVEQTLTRFGILLLVTLIAGFIPAWMIIRQNTLDAILGR